MTRMGTIATAFVRIVSKGGAWAGVVCLLGLFAIISAGALSRYLFNMPILGVDEISGYLNVVIGFLALAYTFQEDRHVRVDVVTGRLSPRARAILEVVSSTLALVLVSQFLRTSVPHWLLLIQRDERAQTYLRTPLDIPYGLMVVGWILLLLAILVHFVGAIRAMRNTFRENQPNNR
jgi:TRAP-type transport system small permease protein